MTREEATEEIKRIKQGMQGDFGWNKSGIEALDMAIKALQTEPCGKDINVPTTDAISRQAAIDIIESWLECDDYNEAERHIMRAMQSVLYDLSSILPVQKVIRCKDCNFAHRDCADNWHCNRVDESSFFIEENGFCAWAEARMEVE